MGDVPVLVCTAGHLVGRRVRVPEGGIGIGRSSENTVVIEDDGVSRYHARLLFDNGSLWLQDAGSRNGIFVNGERLTGHKALKVGDTITIAQHTFELRWEDDLGSQPTTNLPDPREARGADQEGDETGQDQDAPEDGRPRRRWYWPF